MTNTNVSFIIWSERAHNTFTTPSRADGFNNQERAKQKVEKLNGYGRTMQTKVMQHTKQAMKEKIFILVNLSPKLGIIARKDTER